MPRTVPFIRYSLQNFRNTANMHTSRSRRLLALPAPEDGALTSYFDGAKLDMDSSGIYNATKWERNPSGATPRIGISI